MNSGQLDKLKRFYEAEREALFHYTVSWTGDAASAEDLIQQTFMKIMGNGGIPRQIRPYVFRALRNGAIDLARRRDRHPEVQFDLDRLPAEEAPRGEHERLTHALNRLEAPVREVILLKEMDGLTFREIAKVTDNPMGTVASWHRRGLEKLRTILEKEMNE